ncbi:MAG: DHH family phosphoesterase [Oscillospiraceae bacterium]|nr:DHH family phosphoesterase [Oscillospiraceae bacterium]
MPPKLSELVTLLKGHRVFIQTHNFPDPDAIASAFGLQVLLGKFNIPTTICHHGNVERTATANMVSEFGISMTTDKDLKDMKPDDYIITVDSQKGNANILDLVGDEIACIDHHPVFNENVSYKYKDIRIVGSCATIIADYYRLYNIEMPQDVATALLYGLKMDTKDFNRGVTELDVEIYKYLFPKANNQQIRRFQSGVIQYDELEAFVDSMKNIDIYNGVAFAFLNFSCADAFVATVSDFILNLDVVNFCVVYSRKENGFKFSVRSELDELNAGQIVLAALKGVGSGGGHKSMAGGFAVESKVLDISIDFNRVIQNLFLNVIDDIRNEKEESAKEEATAK